MVHQFNVETAKQYGMLEAILLNYFYFWTKKNEANETNFHDGKFWTYNSEKALCELFPYASRQNLRTAIRHLKEKGLIITGNYNQKAYDHTTWYALTEDGIAAQTVENTDCTNLTNRMVNTNQSIVQNQPIDCTNLTNRMVNTNQPIPFNKTQLKDTVNKTQLCKEIVADYNSICVSLPRVTKLTDKRKTHINARLREHSQDEIKMAFIKAEQSDFLSGRQKDWHADFDWITKSEDNIVKILEGHYDNRDRIRDETEKAYNEIMAGVDEEELRKAEEVLR